MSKRFGCAGLVFLGGAGLGSGVGSAGLLIVMETGGFGGGDATGGTGVDGPAEDGCDAPGVGVLGALGVLGTAPCSLASRFKRI